MPSVAVPSPVAGQPARSEVYHAAFWVAFAANLVVVSSNALTFRFAELVNYLGGTERLAGLTVSVATLGAVLARFKIGEAIDRLGRAESLGRVQRAGRAGEPSPSPPPPRWRGWWTERDRPRAAAWCLRRGCRCFLGPIAIHGGAGGAVRVLAWFTCKTLCRPRRRTEAIATFGSSGFLGMMGGTILGDVIFHNTAGDGAVRGAVRGQRGRARGRICSFTLWLTRRQEPPAGGGPPPDPRRGGCWCGTGRARWSWVGGAMGLGFAVSTVFLTRFATQRGLGGIFPFFMGYALSAFYVPAADRGRWSEKVGRHKMIAYGLAGTDRRVRLAAVRDGRVAPHSCRRRCLVGFGHALLFPAVVSLGTETFPLKLPRDRQHLDFGVLRSRDARLRPGAGRDRGLLRPPRLRERE